MKSKNTFKSILALGFKFSIALMLGSCTLGFSNIQSKHNIPTKLYIYAITDSSEWSGQGNRLSMEIRKKFHENTNFIFTDLIESDYILEINIGSRINSILKTDSCKNELRVANESVTCSDIQENKVPEESPSKESLFLIVKARLLKTSTHETLLQKIYSNSNLSPVDYNSIGDKGNGFTLKVLQNRPDLHTLRHLEVIDKSINDYCRELSFDLLRQVKLITQS